MKKLNQVGDTIIEVILAMALLAFVLFSAWAITNRASQLNLTARQRVVMVNQMKEQAELLKSIPQSNEEEFNRFAADSTQDSSTVNMNPCQDIDLAKDDSQQDSSVAHRFLVGVDDATGEPVFSTNKTKSVDGDSSQRVWIQKQTPSNGGYSDFYIRSCWLVTGDSQKLDNSQFIVRLNKQGNP